MTDAELDAIRARAKDTEGVSVNILGEVYAGGKLFCDTPGGIAHAGPVADALLDRAALLAEVDALRGVLGDFMQDNAHLVAEGRRQMREEAVAALERDSAAAFKVAGDDFGSDEWHSRAKALEAAADLIAALPLTPKEGT